MNPVSEAFDRAKRNGAGTLVGYVTAGDPNPELTPKIADALIRGGVDVLELGLPFSDPIADGPIIQAASVRALAAGTTPTKVLDIAKQIRRVNQTPVVIMTYYNPVFRLGPKRFCERAKESFVDGIIVPDLPVEEASEYNHVAKKFGLSTIFLAAPSTDDQRLKAIVACSSGFLYLVSHFGVTGTQTAIGDSTLALVKRVLPFTQGKIPLAVGFGVSKPGHVRTLISAGADGVIVGSAFVNIVKSNLEDTNAMLKQLEIAAHELKEATKIS